MTDITSRPISASASAPVSESVSKPDAAADIAAIDTDKITAFGRAALETLAGPGPWNADTFEALGTLAKTITGINFDDYLEE